MRSQKTNSFFFFFGSTENEEGEGENPNPGGDGDGGYGCPTCPEYGIFLAPDRTSCSRFIQCNNGIQSVQNCSTGMHFSIEIGICVDRAIAKCDICRFNTEPIQFWPFEGSCTRYLYRRNSKTM